MDKEKAEEVWLLYGAGLFRPGYYHQNCNIYSSQDHSNSPTVLLSLVHIQQQLMYTNGQQTGNWHARKLVTTL